MGYLDLILADGPVGVWPLNEAEGTVAKGYGPAGDATYTGSGITYRTAGPGGAVPHAIATDGVAGAVVLPSLNGYLGSAQVQTWEILVQNAANITSASAVKGVFNSDTANSIPMQFGIAVSFAAAEVVSLVNTPAGAGDGTAFETFTIEVGWHHHVLTYDGTQNAWFYWLDGRSLGTKSAASGGCFGFLATETFTIARQTTTTFYAHDGLAFPAVYNRRLSLNTILRHSQAARSAAPPDGRNRRRLR